MVTSTVGVSAVITPLGQWPGEWTTVRSGGDTKVEMIGGKLVMTRPAPPEGGSVNSTGAISFWNGSLATSGVLGDFSGSVVLSYPSRANDAWGVIVGAQSTTFTSSATTNNRGFYIGLLPNSAANGGGLYIWENLLTTALPSPLTALASNNQWSGALSANTDLLLEFSVTGATLRASLWNLDPLTQEKTGEVLAAVTYTDDKAITGYFGLDTFRLGGSTSRSFSDLKLTVIPEPGAVALGSMALLVCLVFFGISGKRALL